ncbi:MAG: cyclic nucleotide-binding domain-containing protein [Candidatus Eremiobacteraeota bacterium]|nr:cyclic nucleotide-binding domain-containing protein [Candidatus Eremiobacteraeota bacterium]
MQSDALNTQTMEELEKAISSSPLFFSLEQPVIRSIATLSQTVSFKAGDIIFREGDPGDSFYLIKEGHVKIVRMDGDQELVMAILDPPEGFGEMALLIKQPRTATARASDDIILIQIKRSDLEGLVRNHPELLIQLNRLMAQRVSLLDEKHEQKHKFRSEYRLELDPAILDLLFQLNEVAGGPEQVQHCKETAMLAREMSKILCPMVHEQLFYAGYLHEIGKISLCNDLVRKERAGKEELTDDEKAQVSKIFSTAVEILKPDKILYESVSFIEYLERESYLLMPIETQILQTADDFLMKISRNYLAVNPQEALAQIKDGCETRYNPKVVAALEKTVEKFNSLKVEKQLVFIKQMNIALDFKDHYTLSHSIHTREMSEKIGTRIELSKREMEFLRYGCELHDVGKIYIPTKILVAPRKLTDDEMEIMRRHATYSAQFFQDIPGMDELTNIIKHHHERWDGKGYPDGLAGEEIPRISRIMVIADVYSALTTKRPYRLDDKGNKVGFSNTKALEIMESMPGHFDPELFDIFKKIIVEEEENPEKK